MRLRLVPTLGLLWLSALLSVGCATSARGNGESLYGVHWWDFDGSQIGTGASGGWSIETVLTHSVPWWGPDYFRPLYQELHSNRNASLITRVDYNWGETVPAPGNPDRATWVNSVMDLVDTLGDYCNVWVIGNEPNIVGEGNGWPQSQITPAGYAEIYHEIRSAIKATRPLDEVLVAPPSPGGVIPGVRWMDGNQWLGQTIDAIHALPGADIDGFALHGYGSAFAPPATAVQQFYESYVSQLEVIDAHGEPDATVHITEWARSTPPSGDFAAREAATADFIRGSFADLHAWNQQPGNHNVVSLNWFVHNKDYGGWSEYSLEHWQTLGNPVGDPGDLWTAFLEGANYPAGLTGTRPLPMGTAIGDFNEDLRVDGQDFLIWQRGANLPAPTPQQGDANLDSKVDTEDLAIWQTHYGTDGSPATLSVPEASTLGLLLVAASWVGSDVRTLR